MFFIFLLFASSAMAQLVTDRPDFTESAITVGKRNLQMETGMLVEISDAMGWTHQNVLMPTTLFRYGISKRIELRLLSQLERNVVNDEKILGISDFELGAKINLLNSETLNANIAFISHLILPTGSEVLTQNKLGVVNILAFAHQLSDNIDLGYNIGHYYNDSHDNGLTYSLAMGIGVNDKVGFFLEPYGELTKFDDFEANFNTGLTYLLNDNMQLDFSFGTGITHRMNFISLGFSCLMLSEK